MKELMEKLASVAADPYGYARAWKENGQRKVVGTFPMHCPAELIHATGALPIVVQELDAPITSGGGAMFPFFCGFTRSIVDQVTEDKLGFLDAIVFVDHCVQLLSAADVMRVLRPSMRIHFHQVIASTEQQWSMETALRTLREMQQDLEDLLGVSVSEDDLNASIALFNKNRRLIRRIYELRRSRKASISAADLQVIVKSSMVMDKASHTAILEDVISHLEREGGARRTDKLPLYVSGHLCHAPKPQILRLMEECGIEIVDDDLYHGFRYVSTDVEEGNGDPVVALADAYLRKNKNVPCPTRIAPGVDWNVWLLDRVKAAEAKGLIVLLAKFCEPHYFHYPRIKQAFDDGQVPHLLIETEHEGVPLENLRTKLESFVEMVKHHG